MVKVTIEMDWMDAFSAKFHLSLQLSEYNRKKSEYSKLGAELPPYFDRECEQMLRVIQILDAALISG